jgi:pyridoxamine 5'-phosphate oxidase
VTLAAVEDPLATVAAWVADADADERIAEPRAMQVATVAADGQPSARTVLLRGLDERGLSFFTNLRSRKSRELDGEPRCAAVLVWTATLRQVLVTGAVQPIGRDEVEDYWRTRPRGSRIAAWASPQSEVIPDRAWLEQRYAEVDAEHPGEEVPLPSFWGGWRIVPDAVELWTGRPNRLHDRLRWQRDGATWRSERLAP